MRNTNGFSKPPVALQRARLDNLALVFGDLLRFNDQRQTIANRLPRQAVLIVLPERNMVQRRTMLSVVKLLGEAGHPVRVLNAAEVRKQRNGAPFHADD